MSAIPESALHSPERASQPAMAKAVKAKPRKPSPPPPEPRRPQQERGERRVEEILDAAEAVIGEVGVEEATTNAIAERAGASVGSLYHFFPNKEAIVRALAARYETQIRQIKEVTLGPGAGLVPIPQMVDGIVDPLVRFMEQRPAYFAVFHATQDPRKPYCVSEELHHTIVGKVEALMAVRAPQADPAYRRLQATFSVEYVHRMLEAVWNQPPELRPGMLEELKRVFILHAEMVSSGRDPLREPPDTSS